MSCPRSNRSRLRPALVLLLGMSIAGCSDEPSPAPTKSASEPTQAAPDAKAKKKARAGKEDPGGPDYSGKPGGGGGR